MKALHCNIDTFERDSLPKIVSLEADVSVLEKEGSELFNSLKLK